MKFSFVKYTDANNQLVIEELINKLTIIQSPSAQQYTATIPTDGILLSQMWFWNGGKRKCVSSS